MSDTAGSDQAARGRSLRLAGAVTRALPCAPSAFRTVGSRGALALLGAALCVLAGCGGAPKPTSQTLQGTGYRFEAPTPWTAAGTSSSRSASNGPVDRVEVFTFTLERPYRLALFPKAARELDRVAAKLALELRGRISARSTIRVAGRPARSYRLLYGSGRVQEIVFVLRGQREYELVCQRLVSDPDAPCTQLVTSFAFTGRP